MNILTRHYSAAMVCVCSVNFAESFTTTETMQVRESDPALDIRTELENLHLGITAIITCFN